MYGPLSGPLHGSPLPERHLDLAEQPEEGRPRFSMAPVRALLRQPGDRRVGRGRGRVVPRRVGRAVEAGHGPERGGGDRLVLVVLGFDAGNRTVWVLDHDDILGDPRDDVMWEAVDARLRQPFDGLPVSIVSADAGYLTSAVPWAMPAAPLVDPGRRPLRPRHPDRTPAAVAAPPRRPCCCPPRRALGPRAVDPSRYPVSRARQSPSRPARPCPCRPPRSPPSVTTPPPFPSAPPLTHPDHLRVLPATSTRRPCLAPSVVAGDAVSECSGVPFHVATGVLFHLAVTTPGQTRTRADTRTKWSHNTGTSGRRPPPGGRRSWARPTRRAPERVVQRNGGPAGTCAN